jgi:hypothetical protein
MPVDPFLPEQIGGSNVEPLHFWRTLKRKMCYNL